jgi:hypothetical protein
VVPPGIEPGTHGYDKKKKAEAAIIAIHPIKNVNPT